MQHNTESTPPSTAYQQSSVRTQLRSVGTFGSLVIPDHASAVSELARSTNFIRIAPRVKFLVGLSPKTLQSFYAQHNILTPSIIIVCLPVDPGKAPWSMGPWPQCLDHGRNMYCGHQNIYRVDPSTQYDTNIFSWQCEGDLG